MNTAAKVAVLFVVLAAPPALAAGSSAAREPSAGPPPEVELIWGLKIPMRDGVRLNASVYKPHPQPEPLPAVLTLTPYIADTYHDRAFYFARNGYVFVTVDVRGRGSSEGTFLPMQHDGRDGHDVVEWLAAQSWCNGRVGLWGGSYAGFNQWAIAKEFPPHLSSIAPAAAFFPGVDAPLNRNIFHPYELQWQTLVSGATPNDNLFAESAFWISKYRRLYLEHRPLADLPQIVGNPGLDFETSLQHPYPDSYWDAFTPDADAYARLDLPILTITGHYDDEQPGPLEYYLRHVKHGSPAAVARHFAIIGPWDHAGTRTPKRAFGGWEFGEASLPDLDLLHRQWYDWTLKDGARPDFLEQRVAYYVAGAELWKHVPELPPPAEPLRLYLGSPGTDALDVFRSGTLTREPPSEAEPDRYVYDPLDTRPAELEQEEYEAYITDQRRVLALNGDGLVYHSERFVEELEVTGWMRVSLWLELDVPDTDFHVVLYEILPDGRSIRLTDDLLRARYRESLREPRLVEPGKVQRYEFTGRGFFSRRIAKGSRLRLLVTSPNSIYLEKNYNAGGVVARESGKDARTAHVKLYHDVEHPSYLELPLIR